MRLRSRNLALLIAFVLVVTLLIVAGRAGGRSSQAAQSAPTPTPTPAHLTAHDLKKLLWIEGTWRGTGDVEAPFYERYRFENDNILVVESLADESVSKITDTTRFQLKDGRFGNDGDTSWAATELTESRITFSPVAGAKNTFRWQKESANIWKAIINWPASEKHPARERVYRMERWPPPK